MQPRVTRREVTSFLKVQLLNFPSTRMALFCYPLAELIPRRTLYNLGLRALEQGCRREHALHDAPRGMRHVTVPREEDKVVHGSN